MTGPLCRSYSHIPLFRKTVKGNGEVEAATRRRTVLLRPAAKVNGDKTGGLPVYSKKGTGRSMSARCDALEFSPDSFKKSILLLPATARVQQD